MHTRPETPTDFTSREAAIIPIAAFTANGDMSRLTISLSEGLAAGLTVNEIKEILTQLYAYAGFPRSLNALGTFMGLLAERQQRGVQDAEGPGASALATDKSSLELGTENQTRLVGQPVSGPLFDFAPQIDAYLKSHLFGDIFARDLLSWKERELATIAALTNIPGVNGQLQAHYRISLHNGITAPALARFVAIVRQACGKTVADNAAVVLATVLQ
ncbi:4-carboxymuconolactone decarboxylase [Aeromonas sp. A35_P]|uniref:carboxymuconolactone decarboxylase family protein n=1 Tax=Aeromonas sp. A35_P TaxID=1983805 RepID=UPI000B9A8967|nr:carboxymuconolactone decarboxylase family protein [Aeromonas sp. A35_P]OZG41425.1 4-carboxymuconolactone decarboxylase [Aeromonas sp. A35_P]